MSAIKNYAMSRIEELYNLGYEVSEICLELKTDEDFVRATLGLEECE